MIDMRITNIQALTVFAGWRNWVFVRVSTDVGIDGVGEATLEGHEQSVVAAIGELVPYLVGQDPTEIERLWEIMCYLDPWGGGAVRMTAASGIEAALWDILGKALCVPVWRLLGGRYRDKVRVYANGWYFGARGVPEIARRAKATVDRGFNALKWNPFGRCFRSNPFDVNDRTAEEHSFREAVEVVAAVREAVGPEVDLLIELHGKMSPSDSARFMREIQCYRPLWYEEPIPVDNTDALAALARTVDVPLAWGERRFTRHGFRRLLEMGVVKILQPDICHAGGLLETKKIASLAETWYVPIAPHNPNGLVSTAMALQLAACTPNFLILELFVDDVPWREDVVNESFPTVDSIMAIPDRPGLGVTLNDAAIAAHPYQRVRRPLPTEGR